MQKSYTAKDIDVLEGLDPVRKRPGMYIGGTDNYAMHHLFTEILDNSMDEVIAGFASIIKINILPNHEIEIEDNGRGIPVDLYPKFNKPAVEVILTTLHSGGKFDNKAYQTSGGLHGVGLSVVNALSQSLEITITRDGKKHQQKYSRGKAISQLEVISDTAKNKNGTKIVFKPDHEIFEQVNWDHNYLIEIIRNKAFLVKGVHIKWNCHNDAIVEANESSHNRPQQLDFHYPNGLKDYILEKLQSKIFAAKTNDTNYNLPQMIDEVKNTLFSNTSYLDDDNIDRIEWAVFWPAAIADKYAINQDNRSNSYEIASFCNTIINKQGGSHEQGFKQGILKAIRNFSKILSLKKGELVNAEDCLNNAIIVISAFIKNPQFQGQTKDKLTNVDLAKKIENAIKTSMENWFSQHKKIAENIINHAIFSMDIRKNSKQSQKILRQSYGKKTCLPGKLTDCSQIKAQNSEIFIVEGDSAGGSARQARNRKTQAILPLRGKIINVFSASKNKFLENQEIKNLIIALGCGIDDDFDLKKLRYGKVVIMTDADVDGSHIASLLISFFVKCMPNLIKANKVFLARPPLYKLSTQNKNFYAYDDNHKEQIIKQHKLKNTCQISRFKGLGEMMWAELKETTMDPSKRSLYRIIYDDAHNTIAINQDEENKHSTNNAENNNTNIKNSLLFNDQMHIVQFVNDLMGKNPNKRSIFIKENANLAKVEI